MLKIVKFYAGRMKSDVGPDMARWPGVAHPSSKSWFTNGSNSRGGERALGVQRTGTLCEYSKNNNIIV
jgi:hypothetical protein